MSKQDLETLIEGAIRHRLIPGMVLWVSRHGKPLLSLARGSRQLEPEPEPMTEDTIFDLGELTQPLATALLTVMVMGREKIGVRETIGTYIPNLPEATRAITLGQLLLHTGGLPATPELHKDFPDSRKIEYTRAVESLLAVRPQHPVGKSVSISQTGYLLLGQWLRRVTGARLQELFAQLVAAPCALADTFFNPPVVLWGRVAATGNCPWRGRWIRGQVFDKDSFCLGGEGGNAGLFATAPSLLRLLSLFENEGMVGDCQLLSASQVHLMRTCLTTGLGARRSLGFMLQEEHSPVGSGFSGDSFGHTGGTGTSVWVEPAGGLTIVALSNSLHLAGSRDGFVEFQRQLYLAIRDRFVQ